MIMPRGRKLLLLPANPWFIAASLALALALNLLPLGRIVWLPDFLLLVLAFWGLREPQHVGMGVAFVLGLVMDVQQAALLGQHALAYTLMMYAISRTQNRLVWYSTPSQALQIAPLFVGVHALMLAVRMLSGGIFPGPWMLAAPLLEALLWPIASWLLLAPQRRAPDRDENRPL